MCECCNSEPDSVTPTGEVILADGVRPAGRQLMVRIGEASRIGKLPILIKSGDRTAWEAYNFRMLYLNGQGNLAARCCSKYSGKHTWSQCGKNPWSNHARGAAVDCGWLTPSGYRSFMLLPGAYKIAVHAGLKAPLWAPWNARIEPWHIELS